jgi:general L-amino acid transport system permease protein
VDVNGNGTFQPASERALVSVPLRIAIAEGRLTTTTQNITESRQIKESVFRFAQVRASEVEDVTVSFADPEEAEGLSIHFEHFPSVGRVYRDLNDNNRFDRGEGGEGEGADRVTFNGIDLVLEVVGYDLRVVSGRGGQVLFPPFEAPAQEDAEASAPAAGGGGGGGGGMGALFGNQQERAGDVESEVTFLPVAPLVYTRPSIPRSAYAGGVSLSSAFLALLLGLVIYTAAFVAEIVRGGIQAVPKGQTEAANALGLSGIQVFGLVIFPQAMRIILPPMISQFLNLTKNSSLAILVTYEDFFNVSNIIGNQTGQFIPVYLIILAGYLGISLLFSLILNIVNARLALVER